MVSKPVSSSDPIPLCGPEATWMLTGLQTGAAEREVGDEGAKALAAALMPRQNPDGTWAFNSVLEALDLEGALYHGTFPYEEL